MRYEEQNNQANHALNSNIQSRRTFGYGVITGGNVTINTGTLGSTENTLSLDATDVLVGGTEYNLSSQSISIDASDSDPRQDVIYVDSSGNVQVAKGTPSAAKTPVSNPDYVDYYEPVPVDLQAVDATVLFRVWVPANAGGLTSDELIDMRMDATITAYSGDFNTVNTGAITFTSIPRNESVKIESYSINGVEGSARFIQQTDSVGTSGTAILDIDSEFNPTHATLNVYGKNESAGDYFVDTVHVVAGVDPSQTIEIESGSPSTRSYSKTSGVIDLTMSSGSYLVYVEVQAHRQL